MTSTNTFKRHPAEVTSDRLLRIWQTSSDQLTPDEIIALHVTRRALMRIAEAAEGGEPS